MANSCRVCGSSTVSGSVVAAWYRAARGAVGDGHFQCGMYAVPVVRLDVPARRGGVTWV